MTKTLIPICDIVKIANISLYESWPYKLLTHANSTVLTSQNELIANNGTYRVSYDGHKGTNK